jgi:hypothetical protein
MSGFRKAKTEQAGLKIGMYGFAAGKESISFIELPVPSAKMAR